MSIVQLEEKTIIDYCGSPGRHNRCSEISEIHVEHDIGRERSTIKAWIPASTTRQGRYKIQACISNEGMIVSTSCDCPVGSRCKHISKVLWRIRDSRNEPIPGPSRRYKKEKSRLQELARKMEHASVYVALTCKSELDSGSDYRHSYFVKDNYDQEILGVFFSKKAAKECCKEYVGWEDDEEEDNSENSGDSDDDSSFVYDSSDYGDYDDDQAATKVWIERRAIEDASSLFHK